MGCGGGPQASSCGPSRPRPRGWPAPHRRLDQLHGLLRPNREAGDTQVQRQKSRHCGFNRRGTLADILQHTGTLDLLDA